jgi:PPK2 family polyphosphate:nucleotide phosphotransferase
VFEAVSSPYLAAFDGSFKAEEMPTEPPAETPGKSELKEQLAALNDELAELQPVLYADDRFALLLIFQALDAAGKDGTIKAVLRGVNPAGCQVSAFKQPSHEELQHDFLWRTTERLPERGRIGVFNRSYYEEVLVVRVHPEYLQAQGIPEDVSLDKLWKQRFKSIRTHERHLARNGTVVLKFWLNVSKEEQRERFLARLDEPEKHWKFRAADVAERAHWNEYMQAYSEAIRATSRPWAPWYVIPADKKSFAHITVADIIVRTLKQLDLDYPKVRKEEEQQFEQMSAQLRAEVE